MALTREQLVNILLFMEQAPHGTGMQSRAWAQTYEAVAKQVEKIDTRTAKEKTK